MSFAFCVPKRSTAWPQKRPCSDIFLPIVELRPRNRIFAGQVNRLRACLLLAHNPDTLLFREPHCFDLAHPAMGRILFSSGGIFQGQTSPYDLIIPNPRFSKSIIVQTRSPSLEKPGLYGSKSPFHLWNSSKKSLGRLNGSNSNCHGA